MSRALRFLPALLLFILPSLSPAMSYPTQTVPIRQVIGPYGFPEHTVALADSVQLAYVDAGKGPNTLIFIHGLSSYVRAWERSIPELSKTARCLAVDLPGYGKSSKGQYTGTMDFYAEVIHQFIQKLHLKKVTLVGHSMGGQIAVTLALKYPADVQKLVLTSPAGFETFTEPERQQLRAFYTVPSIVSTPEAQVRTNHKYNFYRMPAEVDLWIAERLRMMQCDDFAQYAQTVVNSMAGMLDGPIFDRLPQVKQPTLVVFGAEDFLIPNRALHPKLTTAQVSAAGLARLPHAQQVLLPEAGHFAHYEQAAEFNRLVANFVR
ncbi:alpha/beta hydrolase [Hymenobacter humi]